MTVSVSHRRTCRLCDSSNVERDVKLTPVPLSETYTTDRDSAIEAHGQPAVASRAELEICPLARTWPPDVFDISRNQAGRNRHAMTLIRVAAVRKIAELDRRVRAAAGAR